MWWNFKVERESVGGGDFNEIQIEESDPSHFTRLYDMHFGDLWALGA